MSCGPGGWWLKVHTGALLLDPESPQGGQQSLTEILIFFLMYNFCINNKKGIPFILYYILLQVLVLGCRLMQKSGRFCEILQIMQHGEPEWGVCFIAGED